MLLPFLLTHLSYETVEYAYDLPAGPCGLFAFVKEVINDREHQQREHRSRNKSADDDDGERLLAFGADAGGNGGRQQTDGGHKGCHQHRTDKIVYAHLDGGVQGAFLSFYPL